MIHPAGPLAYFGKDSLNTQIPVKIFEMYHDTMMVRGMWHGITFMSPIPERYRDHLQWIHTNIIEGILYAVVDITRFTPDLLTVMKPPECLTINCPLVEFAQAVPNFDIQTEMRRIVMYQKEDGSVPCLTPIVYVQEPSWNTFDGQHEVSYQLKFPGSAIITADKKGRTVPYIENSYDPVDLLHETNKARMLTHYKPLLPFYFSWLKRSATFLSTEEIDPLRYVNNLEQVSHHLWREMRYEERQLRMESDSDSVIVDIQGTRADPREQFDTPTSLTNRLLVNLYRLPLGLADQVRKIRTETFMHVGELISELERLKRNKRAQKATKLLAYMPFENKWYSYDLNIKYEDVFARSDMWTSPYFALVTTRRNEKIDITLIFTLSFERRDTPITKAFVDGRNKLQAFAIANPHFKTISAISKTLMKLKKPGVISLKLLHTGSRYRGLQHLISRLDWCDRWFYHGYFQDNMPGSKELYDYAATSVIREFREMFLSYSITTRVMTDDEFYHKPPERIWAPMESRIPMFEYLPPKSQRFKLHHDNR
jgi:hypothetical protein